MGPFQFIVSSIGSIFVYALIAAGVYKIFQVATDLSEIKDILHDIKRNLRDIPPVETPSQVSYAENLARAVAESYSPESSVETKP